MKMRRIEAFYQNLRHDDSIEDQIVEAQQRGIIESYTLTTLSAMNARRNTDLCLWCDEIWYVGHPCAYAPDYNCRFTFGEDGDGFTFVKVSKEGLKHVAMNDRQNEVHASCRNNLFDEMYEPSSHISPDSALVYGAHKVFDEMLGSILSSNRNPDASFIDENAITDEIEEEIKATDVDEFDVGKVFEQQVGCSYAENQQFTDAHKVFDKMPVPDFILEMAQAAKITQDESINCDHELVSDEFHDDKDDPMEYEWKMFAKLGVLDGSYFHNLVIVGASRERFARFGLLFCSCLFYGKALQIEDELDLHTLVSVPLGMLTPNFQVSTKPSFMSKIVLAVENTIQNIALDLMLLGFAPFGSRILRGSLAEMSLEMEFLELKNGRKSHCNYEEVHKWGKLNVGLPWRERLDDTFELPYVQYDAIYFLGDETPNTSRHGCDNGAQTQRVCVKALNPNRLALLVDTTLYSNSLNLLPTALGEKITIKWLNLMLHMQHGFPLCKFGIMSQYKLFDLGIEMTLPVLFYYLTLEDKGDLEKVGIDSIRCFLFLEVINIWKVNCTVIYVALRVSFQRGECTSYHIEVTVYVLVWLIFHKTMMSTLTLFWVFDPGISGHKSMLFYNFTFGDKGDLKGEGMVQTRHIWIFKSDVMNFIWDNPYKSEEMVLAHFNCGMVICPGSVIDYIGTGLEQPLLSCVAQVC